MAQRPAAGGRKAPTRGGHRLDITVWQFVRIMVQLEAVAKSRGGRRRAGAPAGPEWPVYRDWRPAWQEIDHELTRLGASDAAAFSDLMMNQNVILECRNRSQVNEVTRAIDNVVHQMRAEATASAGDDEHITDLRFEIRELEKLAKKLSGIGRKKVKSAAAKPAADGKVAGAAASAKAGAGAAGRPAGRGGKGGGRQRPQRRSRA